MQEEKDLNVQSQIRETKPFNPLLVALLGGLIGGLVGSSLLSMGGAAPSSILRTQVVDEDSAIIQVVEKTEPAIVSIVGTKVVAVSSPLDDFFFFFGQRPNTGPQTQEREVSAGTGFFVSADGLIATNKHVVSDTAATYKVFTNDGKQHNAEVVAMDPVNDFALIKIAGNNFPTLTFGDSDKVKVGQKVVAIGNALGQFTNTVTTGVVSGINRSIVATGSALSVSQIEGAIQTDAAINPGNSGGPLLDLGGNVIGMNTAISASGQLLGFAIPANDLRRDIEVYHQRRAIVKPYIGVRYIMITQSLKDSENLALDRGAWVTGGNNEPAIVAGSPAERAGLREGDIILKVAGMDVNLERSLASAVRNLSPGETVDLVVYRDGKEITIKLTLGERTN
jgi:serine protease Do